MLSGADKRGRHPADRSADDADYLKQEADHSPHKAEAAKAAVSKNVSETYDKFSAGFKDWYGKAKEKYEKDKAIKAEEGNFNNNLDVTNA